jgi:hypothetical protein
MQLMTLQYLIWPSVENMNANPEWLMPPVGKEETNPYDILIDLVPWYVSQVFSASWITADDSTGPQCANCYTGTLKNIRSDKSLV